MKAEQEKEERSALQIAYEKVCRLGKKHVDLIREYRLAKQTLWRIRQGKVGKKSTDRYYLTVFVCILDEEYKRRIRNGNEYATEVLKWMREILLATL